MPVGWHDLFALFRCRLSDSGRSGPFAATVSFKCFKDKAIIGDGNDYIL